MAITHIQDKTTSSGGAASVVVALTSNLGSGNTLIATTFLPAYVDTVSVVDNLGNRWIQTATSYTTIGGAEIFYARGVKPGAASVTFTFNATGSIQVNVAEYAGVWYVDPLDQWSQNYGMSASPAVQTLTPRSSGELFVGATVVGGASISANPSGYTALSGTGASVSGAYYINSGSVSSTPRWTASASTASWATVGACFVSGANGLNPLLRFPETLVQVSTTNNYQNPLNGLGTWTNISSYVERMQIGPFGRQHELDRIQATSANFTVNARDGSFNAWNTNSFLYNGGLGLKPMNPFQVTAAWNGITYPKYYGYFQSIKLDIKDVLNVNATIQCNDLLQLLSLKYLSNNNYASLVESDGGANLAAYYRLGDEIATSTVIDSSGNNNTGSLVSGLGGIPSYGQLGPFLSDSSTALDLTNGTNTSNGGFKTVDNTTEPPTNHDFLKSSASIQVTSFSLPSPGNAEAVCAGPDGNVWFAVQGAAGSVVKTTPAGVSTAYVLAGAQPTGVCSDGTNLWVSDFNAAVWKVTTAGVATKYTLTAATAGDVCYGPDGNIWVGDESGYVWKVTTSGSVGPKIGLSSVQAFGVCTGSDNNIWVAGQDGSNTQIGAVCKVVPATNAVTKYDITTTGTFNGICNGPDGNLWTTNYNSTARTGGRVWKIGTSGTLLANYLLPGSSPIGICSDGTYLWVADPKYTSQLGGGAWKVTTSGGTQPYWFQNALAYPTSICLGADGNMWLGDVDYDYIVWRLPRNGTNGWSFECWFKWAGAKPQFTLNPGTSSSVAAVPNGVVFHATSTLSTSFAVELQLGTAEYSQYSTSGTLVNYQNAIYFGSATVPSVLAVSPINLFDGNWHHLVVNSGFNSYPVAYIDSNLASQFAPAVTSFGNLTNINVGTPPQGTTGLTPAAGVLETNSTPATAFPGELSDVAFYSGINLTASQVQNHYLTGTWFQQQEFGAISGGTTVARLNKALQVLGLNPLYALSVPYPFRTLLYAEANPLTTTSGLNYMQTITESEPGVIFQNPTGTISAYNRQYQYLSPNSNTSQAVFGDYPAATYYYEGNTLSVEMDDLDTWNEIQAQSGRPGSQLQTWGPNQYPLNASASTAAYSASVYGNRTMQGLTSLQQQYDGDALALAQNYAKWYNLPLERVTQIRINSQSNNGNNITQILGRGLMDQITVSYTGQTSSTTFTQNSVIEQITDSVDMNNPTWATTYALSPYELLMSPTVLGSYQFGVSTSVLTL